MVLLDTHIAIWLFIEPERLSPAARGAIRSSGMTTPNLGLSSVSLYEIASALHRGRVQSKLSPDVFLKQLQSYVHILHPTAAISITAAQLPPSFPGDPMDRIITATALAGGMPLVTADKRIHQARVVETIW